MSDSLKVSLLKPYPMDYLGNTQKYGITKSIIDSTSTLTSLRSLSLPDSSKDQTLENMHLNITPLEMPLLEDPKFDATIIDNDEITLNSKLHQFVRGRGHISTKDDAEFNALTLPIKQLLYNRLGGQDESFDPSQYAFEQFQQDVWAYQRRKKISKNGGHLGPRTSRALLGMRYTRYDEYLKTPRTPINQAKPEAKPEANEKRISSPVEQKNGGPPPLSPILFAKQYSEINKIVATFHSQYAIERARNTLFSKGLRVIEPYSNKSDPAPSIDKQQNHLHELEGSLDYLADGPEKVKLKAYVWLQQAEIEYISHREVGTKNTYHAVYQLLDKNRPVARNLSCYAKIREAEVLLRACNVFDIFTNLFFNKREYALRLLTDVEAELSKSQFTEDTIFRKRIAFLRSERGQEAVREDNTDRLKDTFKAPEIH